MRAWLSGGDSRNRSEDCARRLADETRQGVIEVPRHDRIRPNSDLPTTLGPRDCERLAGDGDDDRFVFWLGA